VGNLVVIGTQLNVTDLSKDRHFLKFRNVVTIKVSDSLTSLNYVVDRKCHPVSYDFF
jgi:hypothetical protein